MTLKRIITHWTASTYEPNHIDFEHYHYLVTGDGLVIEGKHKPSDNINCYDGKYAPHTGGGNTGSIGVALCGMLGYVDKDNVGNYPLKEVQFVEAIKLLARLCKQYNIKVSPETVMTHYEFGIKNPKTSSRGKIDINHLPCYPSIDNVGDFIRLMVKIEQDRNINAK